MRNSDCGLFARLFGSRKPTSDPLNPQGQPTIKIHGDGWILCQDAQPDFGVTVLVSDGAGLLGLGVRTSTPIMTIDGKTQEAWRLAHLHSPLSGIVAWQPAPGPLFEMAGE